MNLTRPEFWISKSLFYDCEAECAADGCKVGYSTYTQSAISACVRPSEPNLNKCSVPFFRTRQKSAFGPDVKRLSSWVTFIPD